MNVVKSFATPVSYLIEINNLGLVEGAKNQLSKLTLTDIILLTNNFKSSDNLNQIGSVKLKLIEENIKKTEEYKLIKKFI